MTLERFADWRQSHNRWKTVIPAMNAADGRVNVAMLAVHEVTASALSGMFDLFSSTGRDWPFIVSRVAGEQKMYPYAVARSREEFRAANGIRIAPDFDFAECPVSDIVCIPDFFVSPEETITGLYLPEAQWLRQMHERGAMLASACSGAMLLGEAGLLKNCDATIHWGYVAALANNYPGVNVRIDQSLVLSGEAQRTIMAGGGSSWQDLALYLIARFDGLKEAMEIVM
jgi:transcriptional regulator GlxA family with amidase domain